MKHLEQPLTAHGTPCKGYVQGECEVCKIAFWERQWSYNRSERHFCPKGCYGAFQTGKKRVVKEKSAPSRPTCYADYQRIAAEREQRLTGKVTPELARSIAFYDRHPDYLKIVGNLAKVLG